jgi:GT2 family glycosyltransferase
VNAPLARLAADTVRRVTANLDWSSPAQARVLTDAAITALRERDALAAWLAADRLVRRSRPGSARPLVLRAAALARLGDAAAARADLEAARLADPDDPVLNQALLSAPGSRDRIAAATRLIAAAGRLDFTPDSVDAGLADALRVVAEAGHPAVLVARDAGPTIAVRVWSRTADDPALRWSDGIRTGSIAAPMMEGGLSDAFPFSAAVTLPWPEGAGALDLTCHGGAGLAIPGVLRRTASNDRPAPPAPSLVASATRSLLVVVPVYDDFEATRACFESLHAALPNDRPARVIAVDDRAPDPAISALLDELAASGRVTLLRNPVNLGFAASANRAFDLREAGEDVLLLNADTIVPRGAIERLAAQAHADPAIGTVTPLSNNGEDTSLPVRFTANPLPSPDEIDRLDALAQAANGVAPVDLPNGIGFCLYIKAPVLDRLGGLSLTFERGYYEDVDFCLRAAELGFRNVCATNVYVGHGGTRSFKAEKQALVRRNLPILERKYPAYAEVSATFFRTDPLRDAIGRIEEAWLRDGEAVSLTIVPADLPPWLAGRFARALAPRGRALLARVASDEAGVHVTLTADDGGMPQNLRWRFSGTDVTADVAARLAALPVSAVQIVDPDRLPGGVVAACGQLEGTVTSRAAAVVPGFPAAGITMIDEPAEAAPPCASPLLLAVLAEPDDAAAWPLTRGIARRLRRGAAPVATCFLGEPDRSFPLSAADGVFASGPIARADIAVWLARLGGGACLLASRRYGLADPRAEAWPRQGVPVAVFDPRVTAPARDGLRLLLPISLPDAAVAEALASWLESLNLQAPAALAS